MEIAVIVGFIIGALFLSSAFGGSKLRPNECPGCGRDSLETVSGFFSGEYRRCSRTVMCGWSEKKDRAEQKSREDQNAKECAAAKARDDDRVIALMYEQERRARQNAESQSRGW